MGRLILFFLLFIFSTGYSQTFEMYELGKLSLASDEYFEYVVAEKGYKYFETKNEQDYTAKVYVISSKEGKSYFITKLKYKNNKEVLVSYRTTIDG
jgi:HJR/Mrr/RecB family endonuclease